ncbi:MAG TPA: hypothetical protein VG942_10800 [Hyphomonadaceae bacterium]|nr:hypothetical protein [Hyphomonadaceae bacterium]
MDSGSQIPRGVQGPAFWLGFLIYSLFWFFMMLGVAVVVLLVVGQARTVNGWLATPLGVLFVGGVYWRFRLSLRRGVPEEANGLRGFGRGLWAAAIGISGEFLRRRKQE